MDRQQKHVDSDNVMSEKKHWWEEEPLRIFEICSILEKPDRLDPATEAGKKASHHANAEHLHVIVMTEGVDDRRFYFKTNAGIVEQPDFLANYLPEARKRGVRVIVYFNVHWYAVEFGNRHPDWRQIREDGSPINNVYATGTSFCVNSPYRDWCFQILRDLCAYPIDGIFYDGPIFFSNTCYCQACQQKFQAQYGVTLPPKSQRTHQDFPKLLEFQTQSLVNFLHDSRRIIKTINPEVLFYMNGAGRDANWPTGRMNRELITEQDLLGTEGGFLYGDLRQTPVWKPGCNAKLAETQAQGKPTVMFNCAGHKRWNFYLLPKTEISLLYADTIANGANVWFAVFPDDIGQPELSAIAEMNAFVRDHSQYYVGTRSAAKVALVWSDVTANFYEGSHVSRSDFTAEIKGGRVGNVDAEFSGFYDTLLRHHIPFDVIDDVSLEREDLSRYELLILPNVACMSQTTASQLRQYVTASGNIVATFETSLYDAHGKQLDDFQLGDLFGVQSHKQILGPREWDYLVKLKNHPALHAITQRWIPSPRYGHAVKATQGEPLLALTEGLKGCYDHVPISSDDAALVQKQVGAGRVIFAPSDLGSCVDEFHFREHLGLIGNLVNWLSPPRLQIEGAPASVEVTLRTQPGRWLIHFVNFTGEMLRPIERVLPVRELKISLRNTGKVKSVKALRCRQELPFQQDDLSVSFLLPQLLEYEVIVVDAAENEKS